MPAQTEWMMEKKVDTDQDVYLHALAAKGTLAEFEDLCDAEDRGEPVESVDVATFLADARAACRK